MSAEQNLTTQQAKYTYNRWASWSLIFSLLWGFGLMSLLGIGTGILALRQIRQSEPRIKGKLRAITAIVIGSSGFIFALLHISTIKEMLAM